MRYRNQGRRFSSARRARIRDSTLFSSLSLDCDIGTNCNTLKRFRRSVPAGTACWNRAGRISSAATRMTTLRLVVVVVPHRRHSHRRRPVAAVHLASISNMSSSSSPTSSSRPSPPAPPLASFHALISAMVTILLLLLLLYLKPRLVVFLLPTILSGCVRLSSFLLCSSRPSVGPCVVRHIPRSSVVRRGEIARAWDGWETGKRKAPV